MAGLKFNAFAGVIPRTSARLIDQRNATTADNIKPFSGELRSWKRPLKVVSPTKKAAGAIQSIYRLTSSGVDYWLNWLTDVDVVPGPLAGDTSKRLYYTGDNSPKKTNLALATSGIDYPFDHYEMGIPAPAAPTAAIGAAGAGTPASRTYLVTFGNVWGEEGPPSVVSGAVTFNATGFTINLSGIDTGKKACTIARVGSVATATCVGHGIRNQSKATMSGAAQAEYNGTFVMTVIDADHFSYTVTGTPATPATGSPVVLRNYGLDKRYIYRSLVGSNGVTAWQRLTTINDLTTTTYADSTIDTGLEIVCPTFDPLTSGSAWSEPPEAMRGLIKFGNDGMAGFYENVLCLCEPGAPHAWPIRYQIAFTNRIVGIRAYGSTIVVAQEGIPSTVTGTHPENLSAAEVEDWKEPAVSKRGMADAPGGVYYPSPNGLVLGGLGGFSNTTEGLFTGGEAGEWLAQIYPSTLTGVVYDGRYFGFFTTGTGAGRGVILPKNGDPPGAMFVNLYITAAWVDPLNGRLYVVHENDIKEWDSDPNNLMPYEWVSKEVVLAKPVNFGRFVVEATYSLLVDTAAQAAQLAANAAYNATILAASETYPKTGKTKGEFDGAMWNELTWDGSLLREIPNNGQFYDSRYMLFEAMTEVDGTMTTVHSESVDDKDMRTMPSGFKSDVWKFRLAGNIPATALKVASTPRELKQL